ncbi:MAG: protein kinase [Caldisericia bacterium]|nr:protein kinase [Caldisericia bacterium]
MNKSIAGYDVIELIGRGGTSSVYKCMDPISGNIFAVKHFDLSAQPSEQLREAMRQHWQQEVQLLEQLIHPSVIRIIGSGYDKDNPYIVLEYIERLREPTLNWKSTVSVMLQVAQALEYSHSLGIIHRDVKPTNVLIFGPADHPRVKVSDFGIAMEMVDISNIQPLSDMSGSCHYVSPELIDGREVSPSTDLYGLGLVSYELLTGKKAFDGESPSQVFGSILIDEPIKPSVYDPSIPAFLDKIVLRLLRKNPEERYQSASELVADLTGLMESDFAGPLPTRMLLRFSQMAPSIGRQTEINILKNDLAQSIEGSFTCRVIIGPVGMGKSRLVYETSSIAKAWGFKHTSITCTPDQKENAFSLIAKLSQKLEKNLKHKPAIEQQSGMFPENPFDIEPYNEMWVILMDLLMANQDRKPLLVTIDDIHHADNQSLEILVKLMEAQWQSRIMFILTANTEYLNPKEAPNQFCERARTLNKLIKLFPLESHQITEIVRSTFGTDLIPDNLMNFLFNESSGNPLYLEELLRSLVSQGAIEAIGKELIVKTDNLQAPESLLRLQGISISALNESTGELLRIAAIIGSNFTASLLAEASARPMPEISRAIDDAINNMVIEAFTEDGIESYSFRNDRVRKNLISSMNQRMLAVVHDQAAKAIIKIHEKNIGSHIDEVAEHCLSGTKPQTAVPYLLESSRKHLERFNPGKSYEMAAKALELSQDDSDNAFEAHICLAQVHIQQLQANKAYEHATKADELAGKLPLLSPLNRARADTVLVEALALLGRYTESIKTAEKAIEQASPVSNRIVSRLEATIGQNGAHIDVGAAEKHAQKAIESSENYVSERVHAMTILSQIYERKGSIEEASNILDKAIELGLEVDPKMPSLSQLELAKIQLIHQCQKRSGLENLAKAEESARICQNPGMLLMCNITRGQLLFYDGETEESMNVFSSCEKMVRDFGTLPNLSLILYYLSRSALFFGDLATANRKLIEAREIQNRTGWTMLKSILALEIDISLASSDLLRASQSMKDYQTKALKSNPEVEGEIRYNIACSKLEQLKKNHQQAYKNAFKAYEMASSSGLLLSLINSQIQISDIIASSIMENAKTGYISGNAFDVAVSMLDEGFITAIQSGFKMPVINCSVARGRLLFAQSRADQAKTSELSDQANAGYEKARLLAIESGNIRLATNIESEKTILSSGG